MPDFQRLRDVRCFLLDMDGTFFLSDKLLPGAAEFLEFCDQKGIGYLFLTNNSSKDRSQYSQKLQKLGVTVEEDHIFTSGEATAIYLKKNFPGARLSVTGTPALEKELQNHGFSLMKTGADVTVLGFDTSLTYEKLVDLCNEVRRGIPYVATHPDFNCPVENGFIPDIGAFMALVEASTGRRPDVVIGKPNQPIVDALAQKTGLPLSQLVMVGDRLYTDIALGRTGITTVLVLSGESTLQELGESPFRPTYVMENLAELLHTMQTLG